MKVCMLSSTFHPSVGGAETYAATIAEGVGKRGHEVIVVTDGYGVNVTSELPHTDVHRIDTSAALFKQRSQILWEQMAFGLLPELVKHIRGVDIIHANSHEVAIFAAIVGADLGIPVVATFHDQAPEDGIGGVGRSRLVYSHLPIERFIVPSKFYADKALRFGADPDKVKLVYLGVDAEKFQPADKAAARARLGLGHSDPLVVCAATLKERKGLRPLVEAFASVHRKRPDARLLIAGNTDLVVPDYALALKDDIRRLGLQQVVTIDETVKYDDMPTVFQAGDIVVQPSLAEGLGLALLEGMLTGLTAIGSDITGINEILVHNENGLLVPANEPAPLAEAILTVLDDPTRAQVLAKAGFVTASEHFSRRRMICETISVYEQVLESVKVRAA